MSNFFKNALEDMKEGAKAQHQVDKANFEAAKAESKAQWEEAKAQSNPELRKAAEQAKREEAIAQAKERAAQAQARIDAAKNGSTPAPLTMEEAIRDRLVNGFQNWNGGYDGWLEWCNTLYEPDAHYNVYGHRLTLQQYKDMMGQLFQHYTMELGAFDNMLIQDGWAAIRYTVKVKNLDTGEEILQNTMEFVNFKENPAPIGVRVVEGWALSDSPLSAQH